MSALFSPSQPTETTSRKRPKRNALKKLDPNYVYDTQPIQDNNSLIFSPLSQDTVPDSQMTAASTPKSSHGSLMRSALSDTLFDDQVSQTVMSPSLLAMTERTVLDERQENSSSPGSKTKESGSQTAPMESTVPDREFALFRSNGNLSVLSNFHQTTVKFKGISFRSAEHAYQHKMAIYHGQHDIALRILNARTPAQAKETSKKVRKCEQWHETKPNIMSEILKAKSQQCPNFKDALLKTGQKKLIHNIDTDSYWGCGPDLKGLNMMGTLLEELRMEIRSGPSLPMPAPAPEAVPTPETTAQVTKPSRPTPEVHRPNPNRPKRKTDAPRLPVTPSEEPPILIIGNSNARQMASILHDNGLNSKSFVYPGGPINYITSRVRHTVSGPDPSHVILMAGDIEAANGMPHDQVVFQYQKLIREVRRVYPWSRVLLVGLTITGNQNRSKAIRSTNALMQHVASIERMITYVDNNTSRLRDEIHLSHDSKLALGRRITTVIKKPHLDSLRRFR